MKSNDFLKNKIDELVSKFPEIKCSYEFDTLDSSYLVKIEPKESIKKVKEFWFKEIKIINYFIKNYPSEGLIVITNNEIFDVKNPIYTKVGKFHNLLKSVSTENFDIKLHVSTMNNLLSDITLNPNIKNIDKITSNINSNISEDVTKITVNKEETEDFSSKNDLALVA